MGGRGRVDMMHDLMMIRPRPGLDRNRSQADKRMDNPGLDHSLCYQRPSGPELFVLPRQLSIGNLQLQVFHIIEGLVLLIDFVDCETSKPGQGLSFLVSLCHD